MKDLFIEEYDALLSAWEEAHPGEPEPADLGERAYDRMREGLADMADRARDEWKERDV